MDYGYNKLEKGLLFVTGVLAVDLIGSGPFHEYLKDLPVFFQMAEEGALAIGTSYFMYKPYKRDAVEYELDDSARYV